jgi:iron complex transport system ATP-binding protein
MKLQITDLDFGYNGRQVLSNVHFSMAEGEILCIMGGNGAGKSTLLKCLNRILTPQRGQILLDGNDVLSMPRKHVAQKIAYVPQQQPDIRLRVFEAVLLGRKPHMHWSGSRKEYRLVERTLSRMGLEQLAFRFLTELSGGELQKTAIARALIQSPEILLLDEPTSNLDLRNQLEVMGLIRRVVKTRNLAAVIAIHDLTAAFRFGDRFLFLHDRHAFSVIEKEDLSEDTIRQVYEVDVRLVKIDGHFVVVPLIDQENIPCV